MRAQHAARTASALGSVRQSLPRPGASVFDEDTEIALAKELIDVLSDLALPMFLGKLIKKVARGVPRIQPNPSGATLSANIRRGLITLTARCAFCPYSYIGGPVGAAAGGRLGDALGNALGLGRKGQSEEDLNLEVARRFVRFAGAAARAASSVKRPARHRPRTKTR
jgi:hypothetical protein